MVGLTCEVRPLNAPLNGPPPTNAPTVTGRRTKLQSRVKEIIQCYGPGTQIGCRCAYSRIVIVAQVSVTSITPRSKHRSKHLSVLPAPALNTINRMSRENLRLQTMQQYSVVREVVYSIMLTIVVTTPTCPGKRNIGTNYSESNNSEL